MNKFCEKCGASLAEDAKFCEECGAQVGSAAQAADKTVAERPYTGQHAYYTQTQQTQQPASGGVLAEYLNMWKNYANFSARTTVRGYWMAYLFNFIALIVLLVIGTVVPPLLFLYSLYTLAILIPSLAISIRRLRDAGKHWGNIFWMFLPIAGAIVLIVMLCKPSVADDGVPVV